MGGQASSVYQQVMEKTKGLLFKCQVLEQNFDKKRKTVSGDGYVSKVRKNTKFDPAPSAFCLGLGQDGV